ncbi:type VI secretion system tip protein VgrG, partial [Pseudomonas idahonensis]
LGMPGEFIVKAAKHIMVGPTHASTTFNSWTQAPFNERVRVMRNGRPLPNYRYALTRNDGARLEGITDGDGWAEMQQSLTTEGYEFHLLGPNK